MLEIRGSEVNDFLRCRKRWQWRWVDGLKPKRPNGKLFFGNLFHRYVETLYITNSYESAFESMKDLYYETDTHLMDQVELDELWELAIGVTENYAKKWMEADSKTITVATEMKFRIPLNDEIMYYGTIDRVYLDEDNRLWFMDHKTTALIDKYEKNAELDRQISRYWWALQQLTKGKGEILSNETWKSSVLSDLFVDARDREIAGFIYNIILKEVPKPPKQLKPTAKVPLAFSKDKSQKTTYDLYMKALKEAFPDDWKSVSLADYSDILAHLNSMETEFGNRFFRRVPVQRLQGEIDASIEELIITCKDMNNPRIYRNITNDCHWDCDFKSICQASMDGSNVDMLIDLAYDKEDIKNG